LVQAVFAEKETGQLVASMLLMLISDDETTDEPTGTYKSIIHGCEMDVQQFSMWLEGTISPEQLCSIQEHPVTKSEIILFH
jgi:hypothetical protein